MKISRYILTITIFLLGNIHAEAQEIISFDAKVSEYGQLRTVLGESWDKVDSLIVTGPINATDFRTMWECAFYGKLSVLNLENAQVENNKIPDYALSDVNKQYWEVDQTIYLGIKKIMLPDNIVEIGKSAFNYMQLEEINLPESLRKLNIYSFANCHWLNVDPLIIPEGVIEIPAQCFVNCQNFKKLVLPSTLRKIKQCAFYNTRMEEVVFREGLECIENAAFHGSSELKKAILPNSCLELGEFAFSMCDSLKELRLPEGIKRIPNNFASFCNLLEKVNIPENVEIINDYAFQWCFALKNIKFLEGLKTIGHTAFHYCNPDSIVFPKSLQYIGGGCCRYWKNLKTIYSKSQIPPFCDEDPDNFGVYSFGGLTSTDIPVYVPVGSADLYRNAQGWSYFNNFIETDEFPEAGIYGVKIDTPNQSKVYWANGNLNIDILNDVELPVSYSVYAIDGKMVQCGYVYSPSYTIQIPKGIYIVQVGNDVHKII